MRKKRLTKAQVIRLRNTVVGCCSAFADRMGCRCLEEATGPMPAVKSQPPVAPQEARSALPPEVASAIASLAHAVENSLGTRHGRAVLISTLRSVVLES